MIGRCAFLGCDSMLGTECRVVWSREYPLACPTHYELLREAEKAPEPLPMVTEAGTLWIMPLWLRKFWLRTQPAR